MSNPDPDPIQVELDDLDFTIYLANDITVTGSCEVTIPFALPTTNDPREEYPDLEFKLFNITATQTDALGNEETIPSPLTAADCEALIIEHIDDETLYQIAQDNYNSPHDEG